MTILNAEQLFLLCVLRGPEPVLAKNLDTHEWTIQHDSLYNEYIKNIPGHTERLKEKDKVKQEISAEETKFRKFGIRENDFGFSLVDKEADMTWYHPKSGQFYNAWDYRGKFGINLHLSEKEKFILKEFLDEELEEV